MGQIPAKSFNPPVGYGQQATNTLTQAAAPMQAALVQGAALNPDPNVGKALMQAQPPTKPMPNNQPQWWRQGQGQGQGSGGGPAMMRGFF